MIQRSVYRSKIKKALSRSRIVSLIGPRQCGKTTLAREVVAPGSGNYFDLEDPLSLARLKEPLLALGSLRGIVVIDEIQRRPDLFPLLRVLADRRPLSARFLILGSASPDLIRHSSESLSGRVEQIDLSGFGLLELGAEHAQKHWVRGGFPLSYLARTNEDSFVWRKNFVQTFLERDVPQFGIGTPAAQLMRFWLMLVHYHGQIWNAAEPARSLGVSEPTVRRYLDILEGFFMLRQLKPWHENLKKRQVKSPKIYFRDSGLLHQLMGVKDHHELVSHPKSGASWEGYALEEIIKTSEPDEIYFWATHTGAELDLLLIKKRKKVGVEVKWVDAPHLTPSMKIACKDLSLDHLLVVYPGNRRFPLSDHVEAVPLSEMMKVNAWNFL